MIFLDENYYQINHLTVKQNSASRQGDSGKNRRQAAAKSGRNKEVDDSSSKNNT
ncbi:TPA: hypothetical protein QDZ66_001548 [Pluralibacter gergoviae]|uniref:hypothetical protein n=1 Tax=Pluralibacter gergoviae TaxID=61647 RepID=UPI000A93D265|nr:hypothetical protein [Pluralibacter gergoviae]EKW6619837.1 hypothetical protein [Pluralibacter gergoviae]ELD4343678.1 hypothetical protein [Pluralibacter gergoviae]HDS1150804.1 hypothetical protein [Pluralibacter gergoviae]